MSRLQGAARCLAVCVVPLWLFAAAGCEGSDASPCDDPAPGEDAATEVGDRDDRTGPDTREDAGSETHDAGGLDPARAQEIIDAHCESAVGEPRVEELAPGLFVAIGFDLANTMLLQTEAGNVIIDAGMTVERAAEAREALEAVAPGEVAALIFTHSHIDHVGGALAWADDDTPIWATDAFVEHFVKQYGAFARAETERGNRQFGRRVGLDHLPCSAIGRRADVGGAIETGALLPTNTFSGATTLSIGGVDIELYEAHGETHEQLYVWIPHIGALLPGDNYYTAFPNLYTIRGTSPRPIDDWIDSIDRMRAHAPRLLVPSHTGPIIGETEVRDALTAYRDGIQWVRDSVVRGANAGLDVDTIASQASLPAHLADRPDLAELYGQLDWSARAIHDGNLGWFDSRTERLYPPTAVARREVAMMGGSAAVLAAAEAAVADDPRWAAHLLGKIRDAGEGGSDEVRAAMAAAYRGVAAGVTNTNGRGWLLERATELEVGPLDAEPPQLNERLIDALPVAVVFNVLPSRLDVVAAAEVHESLQIVFADTRYTLTVRRGVAEVVVGAPLPGTPAPSATLTTDEGTWKRIALGALPAAEALFDGRIAIDDLAAALRFLGLFEADL